MEYSINKAFYDDDDYSKKADWCNKNGYIIKETTPDENGKRRFIITEPPKPTEKELTDTRIREIHTELTNLSEDFIQAELGAVIEDLDERKERFKTLHNELRHLLGKQPRQYN